jgi:hypothetical protein
MASNELMVDGSWLMTNAMAGRKSVQQESRTHHGIFVCTLLCRGSQDGMQTYARLRNFEEKFPRNANRLKNGLESLSTYFLKNLLNWEVASLMEGCVGTGKAIM